MEQSALFCAKNAELNEFFRFEKNKFIKRNPSEQIKKNEALFRADMIISRYMREFAFY